MSELLGRYVEVDGYRTYYESQGDGQPIVCLHMAGADSAQYRHFLPYFANRGYRAIAVDAPGHGKSYPILETYHVPDNMEEWSNWLQAFLGEVGAVDPVLVGAAYSAAAVLHFAAEHPGDLSAVVSAGGTANHRGKLPQDYLDSLIDSNVSAAAVQAAGLAELEPPNATKAARAENGWLSARRVDGPSLHADLIIFNNHDIRDLLRRRPITAPVLNLHGEFDPVTTPQDVDVLRDLIPGLKTEELTGVGHFPMVDDPEQFNIKVAAFLDEVLPSRK